MYGVWPAPTLYSQSDFSQAKVFAPKEKKRERETQLIGPPAPAGLLAISLRWAFSWPPWKVAVGNKHMNHWQCSNGLTPIHRRFARLLADWSSYVLPITQFGNARKDNISCWLCQQRVHFATSALHAIRRSLVVVLKAGQDWHVHIWNTRGFSSLFLPSFLLCEI